MKSEGPKIVEKDKLDIDDLLAKLLDFRMNV